MADIAEFIKSIPARHEALKKRIHNFRYPLSPFYLKIAQVVYFTIPVVIGYQIMQWSTRQATKNLGAKGENMKIQSNDTGNKVDLYAAGTTGQNLALQSLLDSHNKPTEKNP